MKPIKKSEIRVSSSLDFLNQEEKRFLNEGNAENESKKALKIL